MNKEDEELLLVAEVAERFRVSTYTVRAGIKAGTIPAVRIGGRVLVKKSTVDELIERGSGLKTRGSITASPGSAA